MNGLSLYVAGAYQCYMNPFKTHPSLELPAEATHSAKPPSPQPIFLTPSHEYSRKTSQKDTAVLQSRKYSHMSLSGSIAGKSTLSSKIMKCREPKRAFKRKP
jgi:hypothetical protein